MTELFTYTADVPCSADVLKWNYWDLEHFVPIHKGYLNGITLCQSKTFAFSVFWTSLPIIKLPCPTVMLMVENGRYGQLTFAIQLFLISKTTINIKPVDRVNCSVIVNYQFMLPQFLHYIVNKPLAAMTKKWFNNVLSEDMPLRIRRQKVLENGFQDYLGIKKNLTTEQGKSYSCNLPIIPAPGSPLISHSLYTLIS